ncbi:hypothetical protein GCM10010517_68860 [Streptosporangium fragile]|uniref:Uncharacterized protein n=1 Tax=Streptosporangium fragile TaxID=46186 RepID=A0ABN3W8W2_9ACTN
MAPSAHFVKSFTSSRERAPEPWSVGVLSARSPVAWERGSRSKVLRSDVNVEIVSHAQYTQEVWTKVLPAMYVGCVTQ